MAKCDEQFPEVVIYTDGCCLGNPGPGVFGAVIELGGAVSRISNGYQRTTNNRMELRAAIAALNYVADPSRVNLYTDSRYLINGFGKEWKLNGDLWQELDYAARRHRVEMSWVKGHSRNAGNDAADILAKEAACFGSLDDVGYLQRQTSRH